MRRTFLALTAAAVALTGATAAQAQPWGPAYGYVDRDDYRDWRKDQRKRERELRKAEREYLQAERKYAQAQRRYARGQYLPAQYRTSRYIIHDYRTYRLPPPPRGHAYVRHNDDVLLTAITSGLITQVLSNVLGSAPGHYGPYYR